MDFVALDFETANANLGRVCQVGAVLFKGGEPVRLDWQYGVSDCAKTPTDAR